MEDKELLAEFIEKYGPMSCHVSTSTFKEDFEKFKMDKAFEAWKVSCQPWSSKHKEIFEAGYKAAKKD